MTPITDQRLNERAQHFLKALIERYIRDGQPVGSRTLAKDAGMDLSPATIRNVMADLEERGLVVSPHASSGRIPTITGYRLFIDSLLSIQPLSAAEVAKIQAELTTPPNLRSLLDTASRMLSGISRMAGVVLLPRRGRLRFRQIEFLPLSSHRVLAILITHEGEVHNRIIETSRSFNTAELERAGHYLTGLFRNQSMQVVRHKVVDEMREMRNHMDQLMTQAMEMAAQVIEVAEDQQDCLIVGQTNLMAFSDLANVARLRQLFDAFTEKQQILHLLDQCIQAQGVQIFIGEESGYQLLDDCSLVTAPYRVDDEVIGVLGVIGPTRMCYERVIPLVDITAKLLGVALKQREQPPH
ncbi:Heat-inducible transcription repressor HrcA [Gammaproteobacteria bacterium]